MKVFELQKSLLNKSDKKVRLFFQYLNKSENGWREFNAAFTQASAKIVMGTNTALR